LGLQVGLSRAQRGDAVDSATFHKALVQVDKLAAVITQLSDAASLASGDMKAAFETIDFSALIEQGINSYANGSLRHQVLLKQSGATAIVFGDRRGLSLVVANLLDNASKFSPPKAPVRVTVTTHDDEVELVVADDGIGIPQSERDRIFDMFYRASNASNSSTRGLGLGLFICREIVVRHGGKIWLKGESEKGSNFHVSLPVLRRG
jgi:signal transduction histidine kinase